MNTKKLIIYQLLSIILILISIHAFFRTGIENIFTLEFIKSRITEILIISSIIFSNMLITYSYSVKKAIHKKNCLRISLISILIPTILLIFYRIKEAINSIFYSELIIHLLLFIILVLINLSYLKELQKIIKDLIYKRISKS